MSMMTLTCLEKHIFGSVTRGFQSKSARKKIKIRKLLNKVPQKSAIFADLLNKNFKKNPQETFEMRMFCGKPQSLVTLIFGPEGKTNEFGNVEKLLIFPFNSSGKFVFLG